MYCRYCGAEVPDGVKFCPNCGKSFVTPVPPEKSTAGDTGAADRQDRSGSADGKETAYDYAQQNQSRQNTQQNRSWQNTQQNWNTQQNPNWQNAQQNWNAQGAQQNRGPADYQSYEKHVDERTLNGYTVASLVLGIVGFLLPLFGVIPILAIVFGAVGRGQIRSNPKEYRGEEFALAGIILGTIALVLMVVLIVAGISLLTL